MLPQLAGAWPELDPTRMRAFQIGVQPNLRAKAEHDRRDEIAVVEQLRAGVRPALCEGDHAEVEDQEPERR